VKHLLSFVAALAATTAMSLLFAGTATAMQVASTTAAPNPSGYATCTGQNSDGSTATWTVGGGIYYTSAPGAHYQDPNNGYNILGFYNYKPYAPTSNNGACTYTITTSSNIKPGCANIGGSADIWFNRYPGNQGWQHVSTYAISNPFPNWQFTANDPTVTFSEIDDVKQVQYKVTSVQNGQTLGQVATPYL